MITKNLDWAFIRSSVTVDADQSQIEVSFNLRRIDTTKDAAARSLEYGNAPVFTDCKVNEPGLFGDERAKAAVNHVYYLDLTIKSVSGEAVVMPHTVIDLRLPVDNIQSLWLPGIAGPGKNYRAKGMLEFYASLTSHICNLAPMGAFYSAEGVNKLSFALSDCKNIVTVKPGVFEEETAARVSFELFATPAHPQTSYSTTLRLDTALMPVFNAVQNMARFYERTVASDIMPVPAAALGPVYSTWYAFLQNLSEQEIEDQCRIAAECGCKTVIVDDGWQTDDSNRGYAFCGDWKVSTRRFPHMKEHVQRVHDMGLKYMVWFSVPFIGGKSENGPKFKDYCLCYNPRWGAYVLDPRYPNVREFLVTTFANMMKEYNLDGLKLDFIDEFDMRQADEHAQAPDSRRDTESLPDAVDLLMTEIRKALTAVNPDVLIEFRQNYIGPMIRQYGNMFRAHDCPNDTIMNRMTTVDIRATALDTAVHSDMYTWSPLERVESASLQFIHTLFSVPQVSCNFKHINDQHRAMVKHWLSFWEEHKELLMHGSMQAVHPELMYTDIRVTSKDGSEQLCVFSTDHTIELFSDGGDKHKELTKLQDLILVNGAMTESVVVKCSAGTIPVTAQSYDCLGQLQQTLQLTLGSKVEEISIPKSGYLKFIRRQN